MRYTHYSPNRFAYREYFPPAVKWLLISNAAIFVLIYLGLLGDHWLMFALTPGLIVHRSLLFCYQLVTYLFLHGGVWHLLFNMLTLWMFGTTLERDWGTRRFLKYYLLCGAGAGFCDVAVNAALGHWSTRTIGASGAIYGLLLAFGVMYPNQTVLMNFLFPIRAKYFVMIYGAIALLSSLQVNSGVSDVAHLGGMLFGLFYLKVRPRWLLGGAWRNRYTQWKQRRARQRFQVYMRKHGNGGPWVN